MQLNNHILDQWSDAHVYYDLYLQEPKRTKVKTILEEYKWRKRMISESPNGELILNNSFFSDIRNSKKIFLAHTTGNFQEITEDGILYPSGGCLVGSIYCTPLIQVDKRFRMHNLGKYILEYEAPRSIKARHGDPSFLETLIIEVKLPKGIRNQLIGLDYLRLGNIHLNIFQDLEYLLSSRERFKLKNSLVSRIRHSLEYICLCCKGATNSDTFFKLLSKTINDLPILGYIYFEAVSEYLMLFQKNEITETYKEKGEFFNPFYKDMVFNLYPKLLRNFSLSDFNPKFEDIVQYLKTNNQLNYFDLKHMSSYLKDRIIFLTNARLLTKEGATADWCKIEWDYDSLLHYAAPLLGHLLHRELRSFGRYPDFYFYFDQYKALQAWNYWNHAEVAIPFNGIIPKGEVGINPAFTDLDYKVYRTSITTEKDIDFLIPVEELDVRIVPKLIELKRTFMRNKSWNEE